MENNDEYKYLEQIKEILENGKERTDRTGVGTISIFGMQNRYCLRDGVIPLLTTKRVFWRGVLEELLWFIRGDTSSKRLSEKNVKWRHFGGKYRGPNADYKGEGVDQLAEVIQQIRTDPYSRRIIMTAWNPTDLKQMALPPCHTLCQFFVQDGELSCQLYQRSGDMGLGVPFNIASYGLLTHMIAHVCGLKAGELVHTLGDAHIYKNHIDALKAQLERTPCAFPTVHFSEEISEIDDFTSEKIILKNYCPQAPIKMDMAV